MSARTNSLYAKGAVVLDVSADATWADTVDQPIAFRAVGAGSVKVTGIDGVDVVHPVLDGERVSLAIKKYFSTSHGSSGITSLIVYF